MTDLDSVGGPSAEDQDKEEKGNLKITVVDKCDDKKLIEDVGVSAKSLKGVTNSSGEVEFLDISVGSYGVTADKAYPNEDYINFIVHYPKIALSKKALSKESTEAEVENGKTTDIQMKLDVYRTVNKVVLKRIHIDRKSGDYGHWWIEIDGTESYGWWPKYGIPDEENVSGEAPVPPDAPPANAGIVDNIQYLAVRAGYAAQKLLYDVRSHALTQTFLGVEGALNADEALDPHDGDPCDEEYQPVVHDCRTDSDIKTEIRKFAKGYAKKYGSKWSWRFEFGNHCHTFQKRMIDKCRLEDLKEL